MSASLNGYPEEIFRFSVVRNPKILFSDKARDTVVKIVPDDAGEEYKYFTTLVRLRSQAPRKAIIAEAVRLINAPEFGDALKNLKTPLWRYVERLQILPELALSSAYDLIEEVFNKNANELVSDQGFKTDLVIVSDSLVLASVIAPPISGLRTSLMQARRAIAFIQRMAVDGEPKLGSEGLLMATLLLPTSVFPLPPNNKERKDRNNKAYARKKAALEKQRARAQLLLDKISKNRAAADELAGSLSSHLFEQQLRSSSNAGARVSSLSLLPSSRFKKLSSATKGVVIEELNIPETGVDVPFITGQIERANHKLGLELTENFGQY